MHRIALRTLLHHRARLVAAWAGVTFAAALMTIQIGVYEGLRQRASVLVRRVGGDVWIMAKGTKMVDDSEPLAPAAASMARGDACVKRVRPVIVAWLPYRTASGARHTLQLVGAERGEPLLPWSVADGFPGDLREPGTVAIDDGDVDRFELRAPLVGSRLEIAGQSLRVAVVTHGARNVSLIPMAFADIDTARALAGASEGATYWVVDLARTSCAPTLITSIGATRELEAMSARDFAAATEAHVVSESGAGGALAFVALLGLVVGVIIVGQTQFSLVREHVRELGMLRAVGASRREIGAFVAWQSAFVGILGGASGIGLALLAERELSARSVEVVCGAPAIAIGALAVLVMCGVASAISVASVLRIDVAKVLQ